MLGCIIIFGRRIFNNIVFWIMNLWHFYYCTCPIPYYIVYLFTYNFYSVVEYSGQTGGRMRRDKAPHDLFLQCLSLKI